MAKKADIFKQATDLGCEVTSKNTIAELETAIKNASSQAKKEEPKAEAPTAKAGKHSAKGIKEEQEKLEKLEKQRHRDEQAEQEVAKPKKTQKPTRTRLERKGKKFRETAKQIDANQEYALKDAIELTKKTASTKFDSTVELHVRLGVDPKQADQNIRDSIVLPAGSGKIVRVAVYADDEDVKKAKQAGADIAGGEDFLKTLDSGKLEFEVLVSTPKMMRNLSKYARILGPRGLMPNPKSGTVTTDVAKAVKESKGGKVEYRVDSNGIIHLGVGKVSFSNEDLSKNIDAVFQSIKAAKPSSLKKSYVVSIFLTSSMGPSIKVAPSEL